MRRLCKSWCALGLFVVLAVLPAVAHEVDHTVHRETATIVRLVYADGSPFSYESYEIRFRDEEIPIQVGRTDHEGRIVFLPERSGTYRVRAFSEDGHGATLSVDVQAVPSGERIVDADAEQPTAANRLSGLMAGVGIILALFGGISLWRARRRGAV